MKKTVLMGAATVGLAGALVLASTPASAATTTSIHTTDSPSGGRATFTTTYDGGNYPAPQVTVRVCDTKADGYRAYGQFQQGLRDKPMSPVVTVHIGGNGRCTTTTEPTAATMNTAMLVWLEDPAHPGRHLFQKKV